MNNFQQSPVIETPAAVLNCAVSPVRKGDEEPHLPEAFDHSMKQAVRARHAFSPEELAAYAQYKSDHKAWEVRMAKKGYAYKPDTARNTLLDARDTLMAYLQATGAPDEILTIAGGLPSLEIAVYENYLSWDGMRKHHAITVGKYVPILRNAVKTVRLYLNAAKAK